MAFELGWKQVMSNTENNKTFDVEGEAIVALSHHSGGTWNLHLVMPDDSEILLGAFTDNFTQAVRAPRGSRVRISDGNRGAIVWLGRVYKEVAGGLL